MKEADYIAAGDIVRVRIALDAIRATSVEEGEEWERRQSIVRALYSWESKLADKVSGPIQRAPGAKG